MHIFCGERDLFAGKSQRFSYFILKTQTQANVWSMPQEWLTWETTVRMEALPEGRAACAMNNT